MSWNETFLVFKEPHFFQSIISERNHLWGSSFLKNYSKFFVDSWNDAKNSENNFWFWDNCIWIGCVRHSVLLRGNTCHRVSIMLTNSLKISDTTKTQFFELIFFQRHAKMGQKYWRAHLSSDSGPLNALICCLSVSVLTLGFLGI